VVDTSSIIYVVDDDDAVRDALRTLLKSAGYKVEVFNSAQAFIDEEHHQGKACWFLM
jgi:FixJ family two-component response regulator